MSEWKEYKLSEIMELIGGGTPKTTVSEYWGGAIPWLSVTDFNNGKKYCFDAEKKITERGLNESSTKILKKGQIIISARGTVGVLSVLSRDMAFNQSCYGIDAIGDITYNDFLYYLLENNIDSFYSASYGAVFDTITKETFNQILVSIPPLPKQRAIASVLFSLDDKIDLLCRQNKTLEAMAETLFRQWFVEEAKEDWEERSLSSVADFLNGLACQKFPFENNFTKLPVLKIKELRNGFTENSDWVTSKVPEKYIIKNGDVIFSWSGSLLVKVWNGEKCVLNQHLFKVTSEKYPKWFYYFWTKHHLQKFISIAESKATTMGHIKRGDLDVVMVLVPSKEEIEEMRIIMDPIVKKLIKNTKQIRTLKQLRDTLLPKLMNGVVRMKI
jgi:type I restriction enzyme S subunit